MRRMALFALALVVGFPAVLAAAGTPAPSVLASCTIPVVTDAASPFPLADLEPLPAPRDPPLLPQECPNHLGPGAQMTSPVGCTMNFAFTDQLGRFYLGTAGHCVGVGQRVGLAGLGQVGTAVFSVANGAGYDFGLVRLDAGRVPDPSMCHWGGPTGVASPAQSSGVVRQFGYGLVWGQNQFTRARSGYTDPLFTMDPNDFAFVGFAAAGDSGSPVRMDSGEALGLVTHGGGVLFFVPTGSGTRIDQAIRLAEAGTGLDLTLMTAPVA